MRFGWFFFFFGGGKGGAGPCHAPRGREGLGWVGFEGCVCVRGREGHGHGR